MQTDSFQYRIKILLLIIALIITAATFYYTQALVNDLQKSETDIVELYAKSLEFIAQSTSNQTEDFTFVFENIIKRINFPLILTDSEDQPITYEVGSSVKNIEIDSTLSKDEVKLFLIKKIDELASVHKPINVTFQDTIIFNKIYYGNSNIIQKLKYYPYLQILFGLFFITIAYLSFSYVKKNEQSNIWVGMAKEIAHQLGTPISSLLGWTELLKLKHANPEEVLNVSEEMQNDLTRLNKITNRFSKIGSKPILKESDVVSVINNVIKYFSKRLPQTGKQVDIVFNETHPCLTKLNVELFEWVIENLIKNAIDAIGSSNGIIKVSIADSGKSIEVEVEDNGKGINPKNKKDIFKPGYSTKNRGWGLGLSLSKRIINDYHKGKLFLKSSIPNEGPTFKIIIPKII